MRPLFSTDKHSTFLRPHGHPLRSTSLNNLAVHLSTQYNLLEAMDDLDEAIVLGREALNLRPQGHPNRSGSLDNLASYLCNRFTRLKHLQDKEQLFSLYALLVHFRLPLVFLSLEHGSVWRRITSIPRYSI
jgi:hypothetical protein